MTAGIGVPGARRAGSGSRQRQSGDLRDGKAPGQGLPGQGTVRAVLGGKSSGLFKEQRRPRAGGLAAEGGRWGEANGRETPATGSGAEPPRRRRPQRAKQGALTSVVCVFSVEDHSGGDGWRGPVDEGEWRGALPWPEERRGVGSWQGGCDGGRAVGLLRTLDSGPLPSLLRGDGRAVRRREFWRRPSCRVNPEIWEAMRALEGAVSCLVLELRGRWGPRPRGLVIWTGQTAPGSACAPRH